MTFIGSKVRSIRPRGYSLGVGGLGFRVNGLQLRV